MAEMDRDEPKGLKFDSIVVDVAFHPCKDMVASGLIEGDIKIHTYSITEENRLLMTLGHHRKACRAVRFSPDGQKLLTASKDKSIQVVDLNTGVVTQNIAKAHDSPIYSMIVSDENFLVTGDDDGYLKIWDMRVNQSVAELKENEEFISDMVLDKDKKILVATSGDGTVTAFNIRQKKMQMQSELFDAEMLSLSIIKRGHKVVCGTGDGALTIFNWGQWGNQSDRFPGHPLSIDCMVAITDDIICTGSFDGTIRAVSILPNRFLGVIGEHENFPVEHLSLSRDGKYLASCSHDQTVKFWNIESVKEEVVDTRKKAKKSNKPKKLSTAARNDFFADLDDQNNSAGTSQPTDHKSDDDDDDSDNDDDDDESDEVSSDE